MLDFDLLRSFVSVVDTGGFTSAGERVHRTQSTVSQQIKRLEESLGYSLLHREAIMGRRKLWNLVRTLCWTARSGILIWIVSTKLRI